MINKTCLYSWKWLKEMPYWNLDTAGNYFIILLIMMCKNSKSVFKLFLLLCCKIWYIKYSKMIESVSRSTNYLFEVFVSILIRTVKAEASQTISALLLESWRPLTSGDLQRRPGCRWINHLEAMALSVLGEFALQRREEVAFRGSMRLFLQFDLLTGESFVYLPRLT